MKRIFLVGIIISVVGCSGDDDVSPAQVQIRIKNSSSFRYLDIMINTGGGENNYGDIELHRFSEYKSFDYAYRYAYIQLKIEEETFILQPIDYVGETKLAAGKYTYDISATESGNQYDRLSLTLIED